MKKFTLLLICCLGFSAFIEARDLSSSRLQTVNLATPALINQQLQAQLEKNRPRPKDRNTQIKSALKKQQYWYIPKEYRAYAAREGIKAARVITWDVFERETAALRARMNKRNNAFTEYMKGLTQLLTPQEYASTTMSFHAGRPDYGQLTQGEKYIYVAEASAHQTYTLPQEACQILTQVNQRNPSKRILLALEMAVLENNTEQETAPFLPAGKTDPNISISEDYKPLKNCADQLNIDILALDDLIIGPFGKHLASKIGSSFVVFSPTAPHIRKIVNQYPSEYHEAEYAAIHDFLSRTSWGVQQRNKQWARYIRAVEKFYDIIVVYAGDRHVDDTDNIDSVPELINKDGILLSLYTTEQLSSEEQNFFECAEDIQCRNRTHLPIFDITKVQGAEEYFEKFSEEIREQQNSFSKQLSEQGQPYWVQFLSAKEFSERLKSNLPLQQKIDLLTRNAIRADYGLSKLRGFKCVKIYLPNYSSR